MIYNYDEDFLHELDKQKVRETYAKIIALDFEENPIEEIEGKVTSGSISIDGSSAVRRTCTLSLVVPKANINSFYWDMRKKFRLEIGLRNTINPTYPEIVWFKEGVFVVSAFSTNISTTSTTISISGKDKMCLLNGDLGGNLNASIDFGTEEFYDKENNTTTYSKVPIRTIVRESLHTYAQEPYHNIIINDLDEAALELLEYKGDDPIYLLRNVRTDEFENFTTYGNTQCRVGNRSATLATIEDVGGHYDTRVELEPGIGIAPSEVTFAGTAETYTVAKLEYGQSAGYRVTDLVYAGELVSNIGDTLTSIYDRIVNMLGEYEYFYNLDGQFVFQRKRNFVSTSWNNLVKRDSDVFAENSATSSASTYFFEGNTLISSFQNQPVLNNLKNDFSIWGERETISNTKIPVHYRYSINLKPESYRSVNITQSDIIGYNITHADSPMKTQTSVLYTTDQYDWRELIYRMARDFRQYGQLDNFMVKIAESNPQYPLGTTGYEAYYVDMESFWRELYDPELSTDDYFTDGENKYWNKMIVDNPAGLNFWFDLLDAKSSELGKFSVTNVGNRSKVVKDNDVTSIYYREVPNLLFTTYQQYRNSDLKTWTGYIPVFIQSELESMFNISAQGKSAKDVLDNLLYDYTYCVESVSVNAVPVYYLEPNTRVYIKDDLTGIDGEYIVSKITLPLTYNGTMSFSATKAPSRIL